MVRSLLLAAALFAPAVARAEPADTSDREVFVTVGTDVLHTALVAFDHPTQPVLLRMATSDVAVLEMHESQLETLSEAMHDQHDRCAGFMMHDTFEDAQAAAQPGTAAPKPLEYTIDRAAEVARVLPLIEEPEILATIQALSANKNRYYRSESGAAVSVWLRDRWRSYTKRTDVTVELFDQGYPQKSVILTIPGTTKKDEVVVIGGHLDSIAAGANNSNAPGADDDASGIATVDAIAKALLAADFRPERTIQFMAYAAEEVGLRGSQAIVRDYKKRGVNVVGAMQLDMTNFQGSNRDIWLIDDFTSKPQNKFVAQLIERYTAYTWGSDVCGYACSDHASWHRAGVPASMPHETRSRDHNKHIHTARDTLDVSGNSAAHALKFAHVGAAYAIELAKGTFGPAPTMHHESHCMCGHGAADGDGIATWQIIALSVLGLFGLLALARRWP